jgi:hypothetical protein
MWNNGSVLVVCSGLLLSLIGLSLFLASLVDAVRFRKELIAACLFLMGGLRRANSAPLQLESEDVFGRVKKLQETFVLGLVIWIAGLFVLIVSLAA